MDDTREVVILSLPMLRPWREIPHLPIIPVVCQPHFRANVQNFLAIDDDSTVVYDVLMNDRPRKTIEVV